MQGQVEGRCERDTRRGQVSRICGDLGRGAPGRAGHWAERVGRGRGGPLALRLVSRCGNGSGDWR